MQDNIKYAFLKFYHKTPECLTLAEAYLFNYLNSYAVSGKVIYFNESHLATKFQYTEGAVRHLIGNLISKKQIKRRDGSGFEVLNVINNSSFTCIPFSLLNADKRKSAKSFVLSYFRDMRKNGIEPCRKTAKAISSIINVDAQNVRKIINGLKKQGLWITSNQEIETRNKDQEVRNKDLKTRNKDQSLLLDIDCIDTNKDLSNNIDQRSSINNKESFDMPISEKDLQTQAEYEQMMQSQWSEKPTEKPVSEIKPKTCRKTKVDNEVLSERASRVNLGIILSGTGIPKRMLDEFSSPHVVKTLANIQATHYWKDGLKHDVNEVKLVPINVINRELNYFKYYVTRGDGKDKEIRSYVGFFVARLQSSGLFPEPRHVKDEQNKVKDINERRTPKTNSMFNTSRDFGSLKRMIKNNGAA